MSDNAPLGSRPPSRIGTVLALLLVILIAAGAGLGAAYVMHKRPAAYRSSAALLIDQEPGLTLSPNDGVISKLIRLRLKYVDIAQTTTFSDAVAATTGLAPGRVHADISASAAPASLLLQVIATDRDSDVAQRLAQSASEALRDQLTIEQTAIGIRPGARVTLTILSPARPAVRTSPSSARVRLVGVVVGGGVLLAGLVLLDVLRRRRRV